MATVHFTTSDIFKDKLAKLAADNNLDFSLEDEIVLDRRLENAYNAIEGVLLSRGLDLISISTWKRGEEFQLDIATYWYAKDSGWGGKAYDEKDWTKVFDRLKELATLPIISNEGEILARGTGPVAVGQNLLDTNAALGIYP